MASPLSYAANRSEIGFKPVFLAVGQAFQPVKGGRSRPSTFC